MGVNTYNYFLYIYCQNKSFGRYWIYMDLDIYGFIYMDLDIAHWAFFLLDVHIYRTKISFCVCTSLIVYTCYCVCTSFIKYFAATVMYKSINVLC